MPMKSAMWATGHDGLTEHDARFIRKQFENELTGLVRSRELGEERRRALASYGGHLPPHPTVASSTRDDKWVRKNKIKYPPAPYLDPAEFVLASENDQVQHVDAPADSRALSSQIPRRKREVPVRGPNRPVYWIPKHKPPAPGVTTSSEVGAFQHAFGGLYTQVTLNPNLDSEQGRLALARLASHEKAMPYVPSMHTGATAIFGYTSPYRFGELKRRPQLESSRIGAFVSESEDLS
mmetsp:Transcript_22247/g.65583  ORF Transcript_22247/g.65583 Transcript_22247/m.65583 type:complete len:236 (-) Transcript_22247:110-817(-)